MLVEPKFNFSEIKIKADKYRSWCCVIESLHNFSLTERVVGSNIDVLAADRANDLPAVDA